MAVHQAAPAKGPLRVHPTNPRYFTDGSGQAVFLTGSHTWGNLQDYTYAELPSPTNDALRRHSTGVASHSLHLEGRAIDVRLADVRLEYLRDAAVSLQAGGVGFYPQTQFVHIDTGGVRRW